MAANVLRLRAHARRRRAVAAAKHAIEIGDVAEAAVVGDQADLLAGAARVDQPAVRAREALPDWSLPYSAAMLAPGP